MQWRFERRRSCVSCKSTQLGCVVLSFPVRPRYDFRMPCRVKACENCQVTDTVQWRKGENKTLCNKCGLYYARYKSHRPLSKEHVVCE